MNFVLRAAATVTVGLITSLYPGHSSAQSPAVDTAARSTSRTRHAVRWYPTRLLNLNFYALTFGYEQRTGDRWGLELAGGPVLRHRRYPSAPALWGYNAAASGRAYLSGDEFYASFEVDLTTVRYRESAFRQNPSEPYARYQEYTVRTRRQELGLGFGWRPLPRTGGGALDFDIRVGLGVGRSGRFIRGDSGEAPNRGDGRGVFWNRPTGNTWTYYPAPRLRLGIGYRW